MDPTSLPTDNLYKFMALSGVAIVGFFIWFVWKTQREIRGLLTEIEIRKARNEVAQERLNHLLTISDMKAEQRNAKLDRLNAIRNSGAATDDDLETARKLDEEYKIADREAIAALQETYPVKQEQAE